MAIKMKLRMMMKLMIIYLLVPFCYRSVLIVSN